MEEYQNKLLSIFLLNAIPLVLLCIILVSCFFLIPKICKEAKWEKAINPIRIGWILLTITILIWGYGIVSDIYLDLKESDYVEYIGEIVYQEETSSKYHDYYELTDLGICVDSLVSIDSSIQRCEAKVIYTKRSHKAVEIEVYSIRSVNIRKGLSH